MEGVGYLSFWILVECRWGMYVYSIYVCLYSETFQQEPEPEPALNPEIYIYIYT